MAECSFEGLPVELNEISKKIIDAAFAVHRALGPGLLESVYEACLCHELSKRGLAFQRQVILPIYYDGLEIESALRLDLLIENVVIVEVKAVEFVLPVHKAQLLTYMKLAHKRLGLLLNFNVPVMKDGIERMVL
jgi:GxxExxY protein